MAGAPMFSVSFAPSMRKFAISFEGWAKEIKDWRRAWTDVRRLFQSHERQHLDSEGMTTGKKFAPLSDFPGRWTGGKSYAAWKAERYPDLPILQRDRVLYSALVEGGQGSYYKRSRTRMEVGIAPNVRLRTIAEAHQTGAKLYGGGTLPKRPPVRFDPNVRDRRSFGYALSQVMQAHIVLARRKAFSKEIEASIGKGHADSETAARATIAKMIAGTWK